jgi:purine-nucleoside phosphorylase
MDERVVKFKKTAEFILQQTQSAPEVGIVLGSGLGELANSIENPVVIPYADIPHFVHTTAIGHKGNLIFGTIGGKKVLAMQGRFHYYEGYTMEQVTFPIRVMACLGIKTLLVSNAAGGINPAFRVGDLMIIRDHINLLPNPLIGQNIDEMGPRFPDMTRPYDLNLIALAEKLAAAHHIKLQKGVYVAGTGPTYETPAEYAYFGKIGADAVGMSTTPEVIVARHSNIPVLGMSVITNEAHSFSETYVNNHKEVVIAADNAAKTMSTLFSLIIEQITA